MAAYPERDYLRTRRILHFDYGWKSGVDCTPQPLRHITLARILRSEERRAGEVWTGVPSCALPICSSSGVVVPIFSKPLDFFLFSLPAWQLISGWLLTLSVITCVLAAFFILITGGSRVWTARLSRSATLPWRGF